MQYYLNSRAVALLVVLAFVSPLVAGDHIVPLSQGWTPNFYFATTTETEVAIALHQGQSPTDSRVMRKVIDGPEYTTDLTGQVSWLQFSPGTDGHLLAHHRNSAGSKVTLLDSEGLVVWTKDDDRIFSFSTTGEAVYARTPESAVGAGTSVEILNRSDGSSLRTVDAGTALVGVVVFGSGERVVLALGHSLVAMDVGEGIQTAWQIDLGDAEPFIEELRPLGPIRFVVEQSYGSFKIIDDKGNVSYSYDPIVLGQNDPKNDAQDYAQYTVFPTKDPDEFILFDGSTDGLHLSLPTGSLEPTYIDTTTPPGFTLLRKIEAERLTLISATEVRVRVLPSL